MNIMKQFKYIFILTVGVLLLASCKEDTFVSDIENGDNVALFTETDMSISKVSDGQEYEIQVPIRVEGPSVNDLSGDIKVTVEPEFDGIEEEFQAEQGVNFKIENNTLTLKESEAYTDSLIVTMITEGITPPLDNSPMLKLKVVEAVGPDKLVASGKPAEMTLNYACPSDLAGTYNVITSLDGSPTFEHEGEVVIERSGVGAYETGSTGGFWTTEGSPYRPGAVLEFGVRFNDVCGELSIETTNLGGIYGNEVSDNGGSEVEPREGAQDGSFDHFTLKYNIDGLGDYEAVYTKIGD